MGSTKLSNTVVWISIIVIVLVIAVVAFTLRPQSTPQKTPTTQGPESSARVFQINVTKDGFSTEALGASRTDTVEILADHNIQIRVDSLDWALTGNGTRTDVYQWTNKQRTVTILAFKPLRFQPPLVGTYEVKCVAGCNNATTQSFQLVVE